jgi:hypothetical protein
MGRSWNRLRRGGNNEDETISKHLSLKVERVALSPRIGQHDNVKNVTIRGDNINSENRAFSFGRDRRQTLPWSSAIERIDGVDKGWPLFVGLIGEFEFRPLFEEVIEPPSIRESLESISHPESRDQWGKQSYNCNETQQ